MQTYNLTTPQQNIYNETKFYSDTALGNIGGTLEFSMEGLTSEIIEKAINLLIDAAEGLRLRITENDGEVYQYVSEHKYESIPVIDATELTQEQIDEHVSALLRTPITYDGKLYRFEILQKADSWLIVAVMHHIVSDAWSMTVIDDAILHACHALVNGEEPVLNIAPYTDFVAKEQEYFASKKYQKDKAFWSEMYAEHPEYVRLKPNAMTSTSPSANRLYAEVSPALSAQIKVFCNEHEYSPATVFEAAMLIYLDRINGGGKTPSLGLAVLNRDGAKDKKTFGMFISTIPLTAKPSEDKTLGELCAEINDLHLQIFRHQKYPYSHILSDIHQHHADVEKLFDVMMSYQNAQIDAESNVRSKWYTNGNSEVTLAFHIDDRDHLGVYKLNLDYQTEQFPDEAEVALLKDRILCIVEQITSKSDMTVADVDILPESEKNLIIHTFNDTAVDYPSDKCVHQLFEEVAANIPDEIAAVFEGASYTYAELNRMANCIAHALRRGGIGRNDIVPIIAHRSHLVLAAQLGVLKAGGAYLPIDPTFPAERITYMLDDASCKASLILDADAPTNVDFVIDLADEALYAEAPENLDNINEPNDLCYVIYTSGSTGKPKGTMLMHGNVVNFCSNNEHNIITHCITEEQKRIVSTTTIGFDIYVTESLLSLLNGLTVYYANDDESKMQSKLAKLVIENEIEVIQTTPTKMKMYMQDKSDLAWLSHLKVIILGGEVFPESLYEELRHYTEARIWNIYGPTETTVWSSVDEVTSSAITIGNPIANTQILICNEKGDLCPVGIAGELCIAGDGVCRGYLNREELTAEKFIDNPYVPGKLYKTGDLASYRTDGKLLCYGRIDSQVKIRGLRVELGEIESVMNSFEGIVLSATTVKTHGEHQYLVGYYVAEGDIDEKKLREHILAQLPKYMCPHYFMRLEKIAFTPNGKIDRKNLPDVDFESRDSNNEITLPETPLQQEVYEVLCDFIKGTAFGIDEDFFDLGMDSLTAINLTSALSKKYACELSVNDVYKFNTVEKMAEHLSAFASHTKNHDLVLIKKGNDTNIFFIHGGNGSVAEFVGLCNKMPFESTCWGVDLPYSDNNYYPKIIDFPTLAQKYVERIKAVQPNGTYTLCGYCAGGQLALEIAYLLEQAGDTVKIIYNIASLATDLASINTSMQNEEKVKNDDIAFVNALFATTPKNNELLAQCGTENIWQFVYGHLEQFDVVSDVFRRTLQAIMLPIDAVRAIPSFYENDIKTLLYYANVIRSICYGSGRYTGKRTIHAPIYLFSPDKDDMVADIPLNAQLWQSHTTEPLTNIVYDGDHFSWYENGKNEEFLEKFGEMLAHNNDKRVLTASVLPNYRKNKKGENILVTGATGYLGCYILKDLYENTDKKIYCLIRNQEKLNSVLSHHTDIKLPNSRIVCINGDVTQEHLGLDDSIYQTLIGDISDIIHCAATISLFGSWDVSRNVNYMGTRHVIELARKASAKLHHISTISISGDSIVKQKNPHTSFSENDLYIGQSYEDNIYAHSKYLAEQEILENIANDKLDASIYRIGHILWDSNSGKFQDNYYSSDVYMLINAFKEVGKLPVEFASHKMPIIAVNECAKIICHELNAEQNRVYHMYDDSITWGELMATLGVTELVSFAEFAVEAQKYQTQTVKFAEMFLAAIMASNGQFEVNVANEETKKYLREYGCLWNSVNSEYVRKLKLND